MLQRLKKMVNFGKVSPSNPSDTGGRHRPFLMGGMVVTPENSLTISAVWACMDAIAGPLASSDWNVYAGAKGADKKEARPDDNLQYILNTRFNPEMTAQAGKRAMMLSAVSLGTGYAEIERDLSGRIIRLWPILGRRVEPMREIQSGRLFYRIFQEYGGGFVDMDPEDLYIIRGAGLLGFVGDDMIGRAIRSIAIALALNEFTESYFGNGTQLGGFLEYPQKMDDAHFERTKDQFDNKHKGSRNAFKVAILEGGLKFTQLQTDADKAQLSEAKNLSVEDICRWFRVPPHKIGHLLRATNNNIEHQGLEFSRDALRPWKVEIEQEADYKLIPYRGAPKFIEIDLDWAEQGDYKSRMEAYQIAINCGMFSPNVALRKLGENTIGPDGDKRFVNGAAVLLEDIGAAYQQPATALPAPTEDEDTEETTTAWLTSVFNRLKRRVDNRCADLKKSGKTDWKEAGIASTLALVDSELEDLSESLGDRMPMAIQQAHAVINGADPKTAAVSAMERK